MGWRGLCVGLGGPLREKELAVAVATEVAAGVMAGGGEEEECEGGCWRQGVWQSSSGRQRRHV